MDEKKTISGVAYTNDEMKQLFKIRLKDGWMLFVGENEGIRNLEEAVYPPKTELNKLFEYYIHPNFPGGGFALGKRTEKLKDFLNSVPDYDKTLMLIFYKRILKNRNKTVFAVKQFYRKDSITIDEGVNRFVDEKFIIKN